MTKFKTHLTAIFMALLLALMCSIPAMPVFANGGAADPDPQIEVYDKLYYFSDNEKCEGYYKNYILPYLKEYDNAIGGHHTESELMNLSDYDCFKIFYKLYDILKYSEISDSFIILELNNVEAIRYLLGFPYEEGGSDGENILEALFMNLKGNGCKIMFISDVDEVFYRGYFDEDGEFIDKLTFLDHVDIHLNTDVYFMFYTNVLFYACDFGNELRDRTFIFDSSIARDIWNEDSDPLNNEYISVIYKYLKYYQIDNMIENDFTPTSIGDVFAYFNVNLLFYCGEYTLYDAVSKRYYDVSSDYVDDELFELVKDTKFQLVGTSWLGLEAITEFFDVAVSIADNFGIMDVTKYFYNSDDLKYNPAIYFTGTWLPYLNAWFSPRVYDFIMGNDLSKYDLIPLARCIVTDKPYPDEGWLYDWRVQDVEADDAIYEGAQEDYYKGRLEFLYW